MDYKKVSVSIAVLTLLLTAGVTASYAYQDSDGFFKFKPGVGVRANGEIGGRLALNQSQAALDAIEAGEYEAWLKAVGENSEIAGLVNEDNFEQFVKARTLAREGNYAEAHEICREFGFNMQGKFGAGERMNGRLMTSKEEMLAARAAIEAGDFEAWKAVVGDKKPVADAITAENFEQLKLAHQLMLEGKFTEAAAIRAELGLGTGKGQGRGMGQGMGRGMHRFAE